jgi:hypothetical protein
MRLPASWAIPGQVGIAVARETPNSPNAADVTAAKAIFLNVICILLVRQPNSHGGCGCVGCGSGARRELVCEPDGVAVFDALYRLVTNSEERPNVARFVPGEQTRTPHQERHVGGDEAGAVLNYIDRDLI